MSNEFIPNFKSAKSDTNLLWVKGQGTIVRVNEKNFVQLFEVLDFFPKGYSPMYLATNGDSSLIYGYSYSSRNSVLSVNKQETINRNQVNVKKFFEINSNERWVGMDVSFSGEFLIYFSLSKMILKEESSQIQTVLKAEVLSNFSGGIWDVKFTTLFKGEPHNQAHLVKRIKGYDIFLVACIGTLLVIHLNYEEKRFNLIQTFEGLYDSHIVDIMMFLDFIIPVPRADQEPEKLKIIDFNADIRELLDDEDDDESDDLAKEVASKIKLNYLQPDIRLFKLTTKDTQSFSTIATYEKDGVIRVVIAGEGILQVFKSVNHELETLNKNLDESRAYLPRILCGFPLHDQRENDIRNGFIREHSLHDGPNPADPPEAAGSQPEQEE